MGSINFNFFRQLYALMLVLTVTIAITRILCVLLPVKESMLILALGKNNCVKENQLFHFRSLVPEDKQNDRETLAVLRKEYELYKDQWGLNLKFSHEAGESKNYSKILARHIISKTCYQLPRSPWIFKWCISSLTAQPLTRLRRMQR